jgi:ribonuclease HI
VAAYPIVYNNNRSIIARREMHYLYTDGSCSKNPGPGGWGYCLIDESDVCVERNSGSEDPTTNNRMEILGAIEGLIKVQTLSIANLTIISDSAYLVNTMSKDWISGWKADGWRTGNGKAVKNQDLWVKMIDVLNAFSGTVEWKWIKGHAGHKWNEEVDKLAKSAVPGGFK